MKLLKKLLKIAFILALLLCVTLYVSGYGYLFTAVAKTYLKGHKTAFLSDYTEFENRELPASSSPWVWPTHRDYNRVSATPKLEETNVSYGTVSFLIIRNDSIWFEKYYDGYDKSSISNSFSMAKSIVASLLGKAIMEGYISSIDQPVGDFFPQFSEGLAAKLTVGDLASMSSGLEWDESYYSPFSITTKAYFDDDLDELVLDLPVIEPPGEYYKYLSCNTQLLGLLIEKATGTTLTDYLSRSFWQPMGATHEALWQLDESEGVEKAYCCVAATARDFARFGKLYKDNGNWLGEQLLDSAYVAKVTRPRFPNSPHYGYGWWLSNHLGKRIFYMRGHLGQYVVVVPEDNLILVRLGHRNVKSTQEDPHAADFYIYLEEAYKMLYHDS